MSPRNRVDLQARGRGIVIKIEGDGESARRALEMVREQLQQTAEKGEETSNILTEAMERIKRVVEFEVIYEGLHRLVDGMKELVVGSLEMGEALEQASKKTGLSVEALSVMHYASKQLGMDFDGLVTGIGRFDKNISEAATGNKQLAADFKAMGLDAKDLAGRTDGAEVAFHRFISTLAVTTNASDRNRLATDMMGKAGIAQIPVLVELANHWDEMKGKAEAAGVLMNGETAEALAQTNQKMKELGQNITGAGISFTDGLIPGLNQMMDVIRDGKSDRDVFKEWGKDISTMLAYAASAAYGLASGMDTVFALGEGGKLTKFGQIDLQEAKDFAEKAAAFRDIAMGIKPQKSQLDSFLHAPDLNPDAQANIKPFHAQPLGEGKAKSDNSFNTAAAQLAEEQGKLLATTQKAIDEQQLAELEAQHKMLLVDDQTFFSEKLRLQNDALDAEINALRTKGAELQALYDKQHADKTLKRDKSGDSAEELRTQKEMLQVQEQIIALQTSKGRNASAITAEQSAAAKATELNSLKIAADLEKERNAGITAQIALIEREHELEAQKITNAGGSPQDAANIRAQGEVLANKLRIEEVNKQIIATENDYALAVERVADAAKKDPRLKSAAEKEINELNKQEANALRDLVAQYDALAKELGGPFLEEAAKLNAELDKLSTPSKKGDSDFTKSLTEGFLRMGNTIANETAKGKASFKSMAQTMEQDALQLAEKLADQKILSLIAGAGAGAASGSFSDSNSGAGPGFWAKLFGASADHHMSGGPIDAPSVVGEAGPEIWTPPQSGGSIIPAGLSQKLADTGGGNGGINVTSNVINQTSNPVQAQPSKVSYDSDMKSFIIHTVIEDASSGGPTSQIMGGGG